jgi:hypothetical protein
VSDFDGAPLSMYGKKVVASNGVIHDAMVSVLGKHRRGGAGGIKTS